MIRPNQDAINKLVELYQSGNLEEAETKAKELLNQFPDEITVLNILAEIQDGKGQTEEAIKTYQEQVEQAKTRLNNLFSKQKIEPTAAGVRATEMSKADIQRNILKIRREIRRASPNMRAIMKRRLKALRAQLKRAQ